MDRVDWYELSRRLHRLYEGKIEVLPKVPVASRGEFAVWYTPGVAGPALDNAGDPEESFLNTWRWNTVAVVSDGTRVLGLGNVGPEAALPVMEGKALLFKVLGGVDAVPLVHRGRSVEEWLRLLELLEPSFGGVNLEDIESPKCFQLLDETRERLDIPVWHDDQQGTATVTLAGLINAAKLTGRRLREMKIVLLGAGAANIALYRLLRAYGVPAANIAVLDSRGLLHPRRRDIESLREKHPWKHRIAVETGGAWLGSRDAGPAEALRGADALVAASRPGPGVVKPEWVRGMARDAIVFAEANPVPEIWPWEAREAGARVIATGRSDFPNQVNNSLAFPAVFRGVLDVRARAITDEMAIAAALELARFAEERGLREDYIIPGMEEWEVFPRVAAAVAAKASEQGLARKPSSYEEELERARRIISATLEKIRVLRGAGLIAPLPPDVERAIKGYNGSRDG